MTHPLKTAAYVLPLLGLTSIATAQDRGFDGRIDFAVSHLTADFYSQTGITVGGRIDLPYRVSGLAEFTQSSGTTSVVNRTTGETRDVDGRLTTAEFGLGVRVIDTEALTIIPYAARSNFTDVFSVDGRRFRARVESAGYGVDVDFTAEALPVDLFGTYFLSPELDDDGFAFASYFEVGLRFPITVSYYDIEAAVAWRAYDDMNRFSAGGSVPF